MIVKKSSGILYVWWLSVGIGWRQVNRVDSRKDTKRLKRVHCCISDLLVSLWKVRAYRLQWAALTIFKLIGKSSKADFCGWIFLQRISKRQCEINWHWTYFVKKCNYMFETVVVGQSTEWKHSNSKIKAEKLNLQDCAVIIYSGGISMLFIQVVITQCCNINEDVHSQFPFSHKFVINVINK